MKRIRGDLLKSLFYGKDPRNCHADAYATKAAQGVLISLYQEGSNLSGPQVIKVHTEVYTSVKYGGGKIDEEQAGGAFSGKIR